MNQHIHEELLKLQEELQTLDTAVQQIAKAEHIATSVVESAKNIHKKYDGLMKKVLETYTSYLEQTTSLHQDSLQNVQEKINDAVSQTRESMQNAIQSFTRDAQDIAEHYGNNAQKIQTHVESIPALHEDHLTKIQNTINEFLAHTQQDWQNSVQQFSEKIQQSFTPFETRVIEAQKALEGSQEVIHQTQRLLQDFHRLDVPDRLNKLDLAVTGLHQGIQNVLMRLETGERTHLQNIETLERVVKESMHNMSALLLSKIEEQNQEIRELNLEIQESKNRRWSIFGKKRDS